MTHQSRRLRVALDPAVASSRSEVVYVFTTLLEIAGYSAQFVWAPDATTAATSDIDIYYGPRHDIRARVAIPAVPWGFATAPEREATAVYVSGTVEYLRFPGETSAPLREHGFERDIVFASYWLLTGAREPTWPRSRWDDLRADSSVLVRDGLLRRAPVSQYGMHLRRAFESSGVAPMRWPWEGPASAACFAFTHDVDYPQVIRWIEIPRTLARGNVRQAWQLTRESQPYWRFEDWIELERRYGARPTFYFMARRGSLLKFARGTPDAFYDARTPRFRALFALLNDAGAEIGLHASFWSHRSVDALRNERERIENLAQVKVRGNRHHYWHLDPNNPNETLRRHELAGLAYDSSLGFEYYPGWRRGVCHPFRPFHPAERRTINTVQVPPTWMDDHFDRRRSVNRIADADAVAKDLLDVARELSGVCVVDYHARGLHAGFFPRYGPWLARFADRELSHRVQCATASEIANAYEARARQLNAATCDETLGVHDVQQPATRLEIGSLTPSDVAGVAALHHALFSDAEFYGTSIALLGKEFLAQGMYALMLDSPTLQCDVARAEGRVVAFSVYATDKERAFAPLIRNHLLRFGRAASIGLLRNPRSLPALLANLRFLGGERLHFLDDVQGWWILAGVHPDARTRAFEKQCGVRIAHAFAERMERGMQAAGSASWYAVPRADNAPINALLERFGAREVGLRTVGDTTLRYLVKRFAPNAS